MTYCTLPSSFVAILDRRSPNYLKQLKLLVLSIFDAPTSACAEVGLEFSLIYFQDMRETKT